MKTKENSKFSDRIRIFMDIYEITSADLSRKTKIDKSVITKYVNGINTPKASTIEKIADAIDVNSDWLLGLPNSDIDKNSIEIPEVNINSPEIDRRLPKSIEFKALRLISRILTTVFRTEEKYAEEYYTLLSQVKKLNSEGVKALTISAYSLLEDKSLKLKPENRKLLNSTVKEDYKYFKLVNKLTEMVEGEENVSNTRREKQKVDSVNIVLQRKKDLPHK